MRDLGYGTEVRGQSPFDIWKVRENGDLHLKMLIWSWFM